MCNERRHFPTQKTLEFQKFLFLIFLLISKTERLFHRLSDLQLKEGTDHLHIYLMHERFFPFFLICVNHSLRKNESQGMLRYGNSLRMLRQQPQKGYNTAKCCTPFVIIPIQFSTQTVLYCYYRMYRTLTDSKPFCCLPYRCIMVYDVIGDGHRPLFNIFFHGMPLEFFTTYESILFFMLFVIFRFSDIMNKNRKELNMKQLFQHPVFYAFRKTFGGLMIMILADLIANYIFRIFLSQEVCTLLHPIVEISLLTLYVLRIKKKLGSSFLIGFRTDNLRATFLMVSMIFLAVIYNVYELIRVLQAPLEIPAEQLPYAIISSILSGIRPGVSEEYLLRALMMGLILHLAADRKWALPVSLIVSSSVFGMLHFINLTTGAPFNITLLQVLYSTAIGFLYGAAYARSRNILALMITHSMIDIVGTCIRGLYPSVILATEISTLDLAVSLTLITGCIASGLYLLRPSKHHEITSHWGCTLL